jgi:hypothetical protein
MQMHVRLHSSNYLQAQSRDKSLAQRLLHLAASAFAGPEHKMAEKQTHKPTNKQANKHTSNVTKI